MATFLANERNSPGGDITGRTAHIQIMFPLRDKKCRVFENILFWDVDESKQSKKVTLSDITRCIEK